jgi:hypothetical protein
LANTAKNAIINQPPYFENRDWVANFSLNRAGFDPSVKINLSFAALDEYAYERQYTYEHDYEDKK